MRLDRVIENRQRKDLTDLEFARAIIEIRDDLGASAPNMTSNELDDLCRRAAGLVGAHRSQLSPRCLTWTRRSKTCWATLLTELRTRGLARVGYDPSPADGPGRGDRRSTI